MSQTVLMTSVMLMPQTSSGRQWIYCSVHGIHSFYDDFYYKFLLLLSIIMYSSHQLFILNTFAYQFFHNMSLQHLILLLLMLFIQFLNILIKHLGSVGKPLLLDGGNGDVMSLRQRGFTWKPQSSLGIIPPSGNEGYRDVPYLSITSSYVVTT